MAGAWVVEAAIATLTLLLFGKVCGVSITPLVALIALAVGFGLVASIRMPWKPKDPPRR